MNTPDFGVTLTHLTLPASPDAAPTSDPQRLLVVALDAPSRRAAHDLEQTFQWRRWDWPKLPPKNPNWSALFDKTTRTWHGLHAELDNPDAEDSVVIRPPAPQRLPDNMWDILTTTGTVLLCGALKPNFDLAEFKTAMNTKTLHAVLAPALLR
ncbi:hypothetical protein [Streptomyces sp. NPDC057889]|uniref:hypothetical protein n=1 Tax=unclassified Streptomyces TaxID=2593676 RepID=UPI0036A4E0E7